MDDLHPGNAKPGWYIVEVPDGNGYMRFRHIIKKRNWLLIVFQLILCMTMIAMMLYA